VTASTHCLSHGLWNSAQLEDSYLGSLGNEELEVKDVPEVYIAFTDKCFV
jgi:hypothetical protein